MLPLMVEGLLFKMMDLLLRHNNSQDIYMKGWGGEGVRSTIKGNMQELRL